MSFYILSRQGPQRVHTDSKYMRLGVSSSVSYASGQLFDIVSVMAYMPFPLCSTSTVCVQSVIPYSRPDLDLKVQPRAWAYWTS